ncbi:hypothetical protein [Xenorhabdus hominickii]|uniref:Uncharacterized protein n=1 Tax=Xenorhabdus hominickii TaxID=351679 RepID=A0A2G0QCX3_XENHO|nr:hypothetical protein [Xenorhabdus hominickii]AOM41171.1 hypothetical protein A9255_11615 [Xenorhabdus hominickii]PHM55588.1 hypothetical protein Xhom_02334 [Xenorhabdus hominickii]PHM57048.1 hypothetical protein Xhom_00002 [Xenorhabdus hominickii]
MEKGGRENTYGGNKNHGKQITQSSYRSARNGQEKSLPKLAGFCHEKKRAGYRTHLTKFVGSAAQTSYGKTVISRSFVVQGSSKYEYMVMANIRNMRYV